MAFCLIRIVRETSFQVMFLVKTRNLFSLLSSSWITWFKQFFPRLTPWYRHFELSNVGSLIMVLLFRNSGSGTKPTLHQPMDLLTFSTKCVKRGRLVRGESARLSHLTRIRENQFQTTVPRFVIPHSSHRVESTSGLSLFLIHCSFYYYFFFSGLLLPMVQKVVSVNCLADYL